MSVMRFNAGMDNRILFFFGPSGLVWETQVEVETLVQEIFLLLKIIISDLPDF